MQSMLVVGPYHHAQQKHLSGRGDVVGEYHQDLQLVLKEVSRWQKRLRLPILLEEEQTPQIAAVMECMTRAVNLDAFHEEQ